MDLDFNSGLSRSSHKEKSNKGQLSIFLGKSSDGSTGVLSTSVIPCYGHSLFSCRKLLQCTPKPFLCC